MKGRVVLSLEGRIYVLADDGGVLGFSFNEGVAFLKAERVGAVSIFHHFEKVLTFSLPLPFKPSSRGRKVIEGVIWGEVKRRYPDVEGAPYLYQLIESDTFNGARCYLFDREEFEGLVLPFLSRGVRIEGCYPFFSAVALSVAQEPEENKAVVLLHGSKRLVFVFQRDELVFQRAFEGEGERLSSSDGATINMVISHAVQNLRVRPEVILLMGTEGKVNNLALPTRSIHGIGGLGDVLKVAVARGGLEVFDLRCPDLQRTSRRVNRIRTAALGLFLLALLSGIYAGVLLWKVKDKAEGLNQVLRSFSVRMAEAMDKIEEIESFRGKWGMWMSMLEKKAKIPDSRAMLFPLGSLSDIEGIVLDGVYLEPEGKVARISGKIVLDSLAARYSLYRFLKESLTEKGFILQAERWNLMEGKFELELVYQPQGVLQEGIR